ncbi:hypothetical protein EQV77_15925 [Halobacillus fulvus]|nr:hypothetical protein EQV77_15925 [Halobacillus fulvus]
MNNDRLLIERIGRHDKEALQQLYDQYILHLCSIINRTTTNLDQTEEIIKEVFQTVWNKKDLFEGKKHISATLTQLCLKVIQSKDTPA